MFTRRLHLAFLFTALGAVMAYSNYAAAQAAFNTRFDSLPGALIGGSHSGGILYLNTGGADQTGTWIAAVGTLTTFDMRALVRIGGGNGSDGFSWNYSIYDNNAVNGNGDATPGLTVRLLPLSNVMQVILNNSLVAQAGISAAAIRTNTFVPFTVSLNSLRQLRVSYNNTVYINTTLPSWSPASNWVSIFGAHTAGGRTDVQAVDDFVISGSRPTPISIVRLDPNPRTSATGNSARWLMFNNEPLANIDAGDFNIVSSGISFTAPTYSGLPSDVNNDFSSNALPGTTLGSASVVSGVLRLTSNGNNQTGNWAYTPGTPYASFSARFNLYIGGGNGADGFGFHYAPNVENGTSFQGTGSGLTVVFDTYENGGQGTPLVRIIYNGANYSIIGQPLRTGSWVPVNITVMRGGQIKVWHNNQLVGAAFLPGWNPTAAWDFCLSANTGGLNDFHQIDNLSIQSDNIIGTISNISGVGTARMDLISSNNLRDQNATAFSLNNPLTTNALNGETYNIEMTQPGISLSTGAASIVRTPITITATLTEASTNFIQGDLSLVNAQVNSFSGSGTTRTISVSGVNDGVFSVSVPAGVFTDASGNPNAASNSIIRTWDATRPQPTLSTTAPANVTAPITVTLNTGEPTSNLTDIDLNAGLVNATISNFTGSGTSYTFTLNPSGNGNFSVQVPANVYSDTVGNLNFASTVLSRNYDGTDPTPVLTSSAGNPVSSFITVNVNTGDPTTNFIAADISVSNATVSNFSGSGSTYSFRLNPAGPGVFSAWVQPGRYTDSSNNFNVMSNTISRTFDNGSPTPTLSTTATSPVSSAITVQLDAGEDTTNLVAGDINVINGTVVGGVLNGSGQFYTFQVQPIVQGPFTISVNAGVYTDAAGNANLASNALNLSYDNTPPTATLSTTAVSPVNGAITVTVNTGEATTDFDEFDVSTTNASVIGFAGSGQAYTFTLNPSSTGSFSAFILAGAYNDAAGNDNVASNTISLVFDGTSPIPTISTLATSPFSGSMQISLDTGEATTNFDSAGIIVTNGTYLNVVGSGQNYTFDVTGAANGVVSVQIAPGAYTDAAGNNNGASNVITRNFDGVAPTIQTQSPAIGTTIAALNTIQIIFTEPVTGVTAGSLTVNGSPATAVTGSGTGPYSFSGWAATGDGPANTVIVGTGIEDAAGNEFAGDSWANTVNSSLPSADLSSATVNVGDKTNDAFHDFTVTWSESVDGFTASDINVTNGELSDFVGAADTYTFRIAPIADGLVTVLIPAQVTSATAPPNNDNAASGVFTFTHDVTPPVITINGNPNVTISCGIGYVDPGVVSAIDLIDGNITTFVETLGDSVGVTSPPAGSPYEIIYSVTDTAGNSTTVNRSVTIDDNCPLTVQALGGVTLFPVIEGSAANLEVVVTGEIGTVSYNWQKDDGAKAFLDLGAPDSPVFTISSMDETDVGDYRCVVSDAVTTVVSPTFTVVLDDGVPAASAIGLAALAAAVAALGMKRRRK